MLGTYLRLIAPLEIRIVNKQQHWLFSIKQAAWHRTMLEQPAINSKCPSFCESQVYCMSRRMEIKAAAHIRPLEQRWYHANPRTRNKARGEMTIVTFIEPKDCDKG